ARWRASHAFHAAIVLLLLRGALRGGGHVAAAGDALVHLALGVLPEIELAARRGAELGLAGRDALRLGASRAAGVVGQVAHGRAGIVEVQAIGVAALLLDAHLGAGLPSLAGQLLGALAGAHLLQIMVAELLLLDLGLAVVLAARPTAARGVR